MMRFFQISILFLLLSSCSPIVKDYLVQKNSVSQIENNYFSDTKKDYVYKAQIDIYGNYIGGIFIIKPIEKNHHRIVFATEFGARMLDIELKNNKLIKNKIVKKIDRSLIINTLRKDFQILLQEKVKVLNTYRLNENKIYQTKKNNRYNFYFYNFENQLFEIKNTTKYKDKIIFSFSNFVNEEPQNICIKHKNIKLVIDLKRLK